MENGSQIFNKMNRLFLIFSLFAIFPVLCLYGEVSNSIPIDVLISNVLNAENKMKLYMYPLSKEHPTRRISKLPRMYWRLETQLWMLIPKDMWTDDPEKADFYVFIHTLYGNWDRGNNQFTYINKVLYPRLFEIYHKYPYFNRTNGRDHLTVYVGDNGPERDCLFSQIPPTHSLVTDMFKQMIKIGYYGRRDNVSGNNWRSDIDIAMPMFNEFHKRKTTSVEVHVTQGLERNVLYRRKKEHGNEGDGDKGSVLHHFERKVFYFKGNYGNGEYQCEGLTMKSCSAGIRLWLENYLNRQDIRSHVAPPPPPSSSSSSLLNVPYNKSSKHHFIDRGMLSGWYAPCPSGAGCWSTRLYDAIHSLNIPLILSQDAVLPFENYLNYQEFSYIVNHTDDLIQCEERREDSDDKDIELERKSKCLHKRRKVEEMITHLIKETEEMTAHCFDGDTSSNYLINRKDSDNNMVDKIVSSDVTMMKNTVTMMNEPTLTMKCREWKMIKMMYKAYEIRSYFNYDPDNMKSAWGMFLLELSNRKQVR